MPEHSTGEYVIGQIYDVPCVRGTWFSRLDLWPVLGPKHSDSKVIGFTPEHYHLDRRFLTVKQFQFAESHAGARGAGLGRYPLHEPFTRDWPPLESPVMKRKKCLRGPVEFPVVAWTGKLETAYECARMKAGICPHQGAPLAGLPVVDGMVTCPLHGLRWRIGTGELVRRATVTARSA